MTDDDDKKDGDPNKPTPSTNNIPSNQEHSTTNK